MQGINLTGGCANCGGKRWEYFENTSDDFIQEFRCIELNCDIRIFVIQMDNLYPINLLKKFMSLLRITTSWKK